jgi:hypothetical protein
MIVDIYTEGIVEGAIVSLETADAKVSRELCGKDQITFSAKSTVYLDIPIKSSIRITTQAGTWMYRLQELPNYEKKSDVEHVYNFTFRSPIFSLEKVSLVNINGEGDFFYNGTASDHLQIIFDNLTRVGSAIPDSFTKGTAPTDEYKNIQYSEVNCLGALNIICDEFDLEYEHVQAFINLKKKIGNESEVVLEYGKDKPLSNITRSNVDVDKMITRLYYRGSDRNLPLDYAHDRLRGTVDYIEANTDTDYREATVNFDVTPERVGIVTSFEITEDEDYKLVDSSMFDLKAEDIDGNTIYWIPETKPKINFLTGDCAGYTFDILDYDHVSKTIKFIPFDNESGYRVPNENVKPAATDKYVILDIRLPQSYIDDAISRLDAAASEYLAEQSVPRVSYTINSNPSFWAANSLSVNLGDAVTVNDLDLDISSTCRIIAIDFPLADVHDVTMKLSDVRFAVIGRKRAIAQSRSQKAIKVSRINTVEKVQRNQKSTSELKSTVFDFKDNYFIPENNRPESLDPYMLALDSGEIQFSISGIEFSSVGDVVSWTGGTVIHHSFNAKKRSIIEAVRGSYNPTKTWTLASGSTDLMSGKAFFVYLKLPVDGSTATVVFNDNHLWAKSIPDYVLYKLGELGTNVGGARKLRVLWGASGSGGVGHDPVSISSGSQTILGLNGQEISIDLSGYAKVNHTHSGYALTGHNHSFLSIDETPDSWLDSLYNDTNERGLTVGYFGGVHSIIFAPVYGAHSPEIGGYFWIKSLCPEVVGEVPMNYPQLLGKTYNGTASTFSANWRGDSLYIGRGAGLDAYPVDGNVTLTPDGIANLIDGEDNTAIGSGVGNGIFHSSSNILIGAGADIVDDGLDGYLCINLGGIDVIRGYASEIEFAGALTFNADDEFEIMTLPVDPVPAWYNSLGYHNSAMIATSEHQMGYTPYSLLNSLPGAASVQLVDEHGIATWLDISTVGNCYWHETTPDQDYYLTSINTRLKSANPLQSLWIENTNEAYGAASIEFQINNAFDIFEGEQFFSIIGNGRLQGANALILGFDGIVLKTEFEIEAKNHIAISADDSANWGLWHWDDHLELSKDGVSDSAIMFHDDGSIELSAVGKLYRNVVGQQGVSTDEFLLTELLYSQIQGTTVGDILTIIETSPGIKGVSWAEWQLPSDVLVDGDFTSNGLMKRMAAGTYGIVTDNSALWNALKSLGQVDHEVCTQTYYDGLGTGRPSKFYFIPE